MRTTVLRREILLNVKNLIISKYEFTGLKTDPCLWNIPKFISIILYVMCKCNKNNRLAIDHGKKKKKKISHYIGEELRVCL